ncbi:VOC family protein [Nonlabens mediterrranea]|uniref:VOC family protein n=1 Tax=Nonlabens mediterrranea TaxID=1419947 RepID=A0ABS0A3C0_9FLAO|nr:VOC family protein [Nonlabens mediterrranea]
MNVHEDNGMFKFNHIALAVKDVAISIAFYQQLFDFKEIANTASSSNTRWLSLDGYHQLHLIPRPEVKINTNKAIHFALSTIEFQTFIIKLKQLKINYSDWLGTTHKNYRRKDGIQQVYLQDPDGYWIEINNDI